MKKLKYQILFLLMLGFLAIQAQKDHEEKVTINGKVMTALITDGDTMILADLDDVSITSMRSFENAEEYRKFQIYKRYALKVYPYAREAIKIFKEMEVATATLNKRKRKRHIRKLQKELKQEFSDPLKKLTRTQGQILVKMIERELDTPMHRLLKELKGSFTAGYWHQFSKMYGYDLKRGYVEGDDSILDAVLQDFDISYKLN